MISITFKNVDQGDSIILQWNKPDGTKGLGIVDCNLDSKYENQVVKHIEIIDPEKIDFVILTHPHDDHYSGFLELFKYIEDKKLKCSYFIHSCSNIKEILTAPSIASTLSENELSNLGKLYTNAYNLYTKNLIDNYNSISASDYYKIDLDSLVLEFYSPSQKEINDFNKSEHTVKQPKDGRRNSNYNYLSTLIKLSYQDTSILLTSDIKSSSFKRIIGKQPTTHFFKNLKLIQIPHHGGTSSYYKPFWEKIPHKNIPAVVSVGKNIYKHPHKEFINSLSNLGFEIHSTNHIGCLKELKSDLSNSTNDFLDLFEIYELSDSNKHLSGDQIFKFV
jgi:beta-lactamase superfamily II metal-dependent hydrolase